MALTPRPHGITHTEAAISRVLLEVAPTSIWGIVATAPAAVTAGDFAQDKAILITDVEAAVALAGADGTARRALRAISDFGRSIGVLVIVEEGVGEDAAEIAVDQTAKAIAGIALLQSAEQAIGVRPRILAVPGMDTRDVLTALEITAARLNAFAYGAAVGETPAEMHTYRGGFSARELMLIDGDFLAFDEDPLVQDEVVSFATARAVGLRARLDRDVGYHKTLSNVVVPGVTGVTTPRGWDLHSADTEMGLINGADVTGIIRRSGLRFWGNRTCSSDPRYVFESAVRSNQAIRDAIGEGLFPYIDQPNRASLATDIIESINALGRREVRAGRLIGFEAFLAEGNTPDLLAAGKLRIGYRFTPCAPLEDLGVKSEITDEFYADFAQLAGGGAA